MNINAQTPNTKSPIPNPQSPTANILLVDDDPFILKTIGNDLEGKGYKVTTADSGEKAIELLNKSTFDLVITDLVMGDIDGFQVLKTGKELKSEIMAIVLTGYSDVALAIDALRFGADDYLLKPCEPEEMYFRIDNCFEKLEIKKRIRQAEETLRENEERFRTVADFTYDWEYGIAPDGHYVYVSPSCERITGYSPEEFSNEPGLLEKIIHIDDRLDVVSHIREEKEPEETFSIDFRIITRSGDERWISHVCRPVYGADGKYLGRRASNRDISKRVKMWEELLKTKKLESLGTLAGGIAHDFNNALTSVLGNISLARIDTKPGSKVFERLTEAEKAALRAKDLTARLITFSKGGEPLKQEVFVGGLLKDSVESVLSKSEINCEFSIPDDLRPVVIDEGQIRQVIRNVVTNSVEAISACADGAGLSATHKPTAGRQAQGTIKVCCRNVDISEKDGLKLKAGKYVKLSLEDQGPGIPKENLPKIFDPYFSTKKMGLQKGMGLGLAICLSIVKKHDGLIALKSEPGAGTTFFIYLPASDFGLGSGETGDAFQRDSGLKRKLETEKKQVPGKRKILVMDDEEMIRNITGFMLSRLGCDAEFAADGAEAIKLYKKAMESGRPFDAVILDLTNQFGMGGKEAVVKLLEIDPNVKAIISTGYSNDPVLSNFKEYGFCGALPKPYSLEILDKGLEEVMPLICA